MEMDQLRTRIPLFCQCIGLIASISVLLSCLFRLFRIKADIYASVFVLGLSNIPYFTVQYGEIYRLFLSPFIAYSSFQSSSLISSLIGYFFSFIWISSILFVYEITEGTVATILIFLRLVFTTNLLFCLLIYGISIMFSIPHIVILSQCSGWYPLILAFEAIMCDALPPNQTRQVFFIPIRIPGRFYPWFLFSILFLFHSHGFPFDLLCGLIAGYAESRKYLSFITPSTSTIAEIEAIIQNSQMLRQNIRGFIPTPALPGFSSSRNSPSSSANAGDVNVDRLASILSAFRGGVVPPQQQQQMHGNIASSGGIPLGSSSSNTIQSMQQSANSHSRIPQQSISRTPAPSSSSSLTMDSASSQHDDNEESRLKRKEQLRKAALAAAEARMKGEAASATESSLSMSDTNSKQQQPSSSRADSSTSSSLNSEIFEFDHELVTLQNMGFPVQESKRLLIKHKGDLEAVVNELSS